MTRALPCPLAALALALAGLAALPSPAPTAPVPAPRKPKIEVVFCLDTTGSMGGLIDGAKAKIWSICNQIASGKPLPELKVGLVAYKDRGDAYVTKVFELSDDLDAIHGELKKFEASGGGDGPESVNQALDDAVNKIKWSDDKKALRIIFLVGDAPPHMDYADDVKYPVTCKKAAERGILINTVQCGNDAEATKVWKDIAGKAEGSFVAIPQDGGVVVVASPFDKRLGELNAEIGKTCLVYGNRAKQQEQLAQNARAIALDAPAASERVAFQAKNLQVNAFDLLDNIKQNKVKLEEIKKEELPEELKALKTDKERKEYLEKLEKRRAELNKEVLELDRKRTQYVTQKQLEMAKKGKAGFDLEVLEVIRKQAKKFDIGY